jgi:diguanylate cyclase (GGDEF)-like protein
MDTEDGGVELQPVSGLNATTRRLCLFALIGVLLVLSATLVPTFIGDRPFLPHFSLPWWAMTLAMGLAFAGTETFVLNIQARRETQTISFSELPLLLGLFFISPLALLTGRIIASTVVMVGVRKSPPMKVALNVALLIAETSVAIAIFGAISSGATSPGPITWLAAYAGALTADILGAVTVGCAIVAYDGGVNVRALMTDAGSLAVPAMGVTLGLIAVVTLAASTTAGWLLLAFGVLALLAFRAYASLAERHLNLERLYHFSRAVSSAPEVDDVIGNVLTQAKDLLRCEQAAAVFFSADGAFIDVIAYRRGETLGRTTEPTGTRHAWAIRRVLAGETLLVPRNTRDSDARAWLTTNGLRDAIVVPLAGGAEIDGILVVADRLGDVRTFEEDDVLLLETVANHAGVALRNGELIGRLRHDALHDVLTGLPNRTYLQQDLAGALADVAAGTAPGAAVMILDLDEFKDVNDTLGHHHGDDLLVQVGARLIDAIGDAGTVARLGGDEFAVLLPGTADEESVLRLGRRVLRALELPVALDGLDVEVGGSIGIALAPAHAMDAAALLKCADLAMYDGKSASARGLRVYQPDLHATTPRRLTLVSELRGALQDGEIQVHVQPQAELRSGRVVGVEALVRWNHPELGWVSPEEFVPVAERSGLIGLLTTRVLDASLAACALWRAAGRDLAVAVNLSARSLQDADLVDEVARLLLRHDVPADRLTLEVTEGSVMADPARAVAVLHQLRELGVRLSVDDFGTGYSSLSYLQRLPVQEVKIDRSFVADLRTESENVAIVRAIVDLGRHLGLEVVAEGVEDEVTWKLLTSMNCDLVQGWHLARAMPIGEFLGWLSTRDRSRRRGGLRVV